MSRRFEMIRGQTSVRRARHGEREQLMVDIISLCRYTCSAQTDRCRSCLSVVHFIAQEIWIVFYVSAAWWQDRWMVSQCRPYILLYKYRANFRLVERSKTTFCLVRIPDGRAVFQPASYWSVVEHNCHLSITKLCGCTHETTESSTGCFAKTRDMVMKIKLTIFLPLFQLKDVHSWTFFCPPPKDRHATPNCSNQFRVKSPWQRRSRFWNYKLS